MQARNLIRLWQPASQELEGVSAGHMDGAIAEVQSRVPEWRFYNMVEPLRERLRGKTIMDRPELHSLSQTQLGELPDEQKPEMHRWMFLPWDAHYTDYGNRVYAEEVARLLIRRLDQRDEATARQ